MLRPHLGSRLVSTLLAYGVRCRTLACAELCGRMIANLSLLLSLLLSARTAISLRSRSLSALCRFLSPCFLRQLSSPLPLLIFLLVGK